ncbi:hypothetical protein ACFWF3_15640, partial [Nocardia sp. NPDC060220]|uniref:hypothetical protein n=1 Tax=Nocardia sp. NPDC060220 TaxID=3347076 RepID=UPI003663A525
VSVRDLFEAPTPAALDRRLSEGTAPEPADDAPAPAPPPPPPPPPVLQLPFPLPPILLPPAAAVRP